MNIGVIGIGQIAEKAYIPIYQKVRNQGTFIFSTRNKETQEKLKATYGFLHVVSSVDELIKCNIQLCFVHTATAAHFEIVSTLLKQGIHVFVDKPLSESLEEVRMLQKLANENNVLLMIGFNRRFAPYVEQLKQVKNKNSILLQKNRIASSKPTTPTTFMIYDLFLHLVDTAVYLLDSLPKQVQSHIIEKKGKLQRAMLHLETDEMTIVCSMNLFAGANTEMYQVMSDQGTYVVENLTELTVKTAQDIRKQEFNDWETILKRRGFEQMVTTFIEAVKTGKSEQLKQEHVVLSHELCQQMLMKHQRQVM